MSNFFRNVVQEGQNIKVSSLKGGGAANSTAGGRFGTLPQNHLTSAGDISHYGMVFNPVEILWMDGLIFFCRLLFVVVCGPGIIRVVCGA